MGRSSETKIRMSEASLGVAKTEEHKRNLAAANGTRPFVDEMGNVYFSKSDAARRLGIDRVSVKYLLRGRRKQAKGHRLSYVEVR